MEKQALLVAASNDPPFPFEKLPAEIRNEIYAIVLADYPDLPRTVNPKFDTDEQSRPFTWKFMPEDEEDLMNGPDAADVWLPELPGICLTSRKIYKEAMSEFRKQPLVWVLVKIIVNTEVTSQGSEAIMDEIFSALFPKWFPTSYNLVQHPVMHLQITFGSRHNWAAPKGQRHQHQSHTTFVMHYDDLKFLGRAIRRNPFMYSATVTLSFPELFEKGEPLPEHLECLEWLEPLGYPDKEILDYKDFMGVMSKSWTWECEWTEELEGLVSTLEGGVARGNWFQRQGKWHHLIRENTETIAEAKDIEYETRSRDFKYIDDYTRSSICINLSTIAAQLSIAFHHTGDLKASASWRKYALDLVGVENASVSGIITTVFHRGLVLMKLDEYEAAANCFLASMEIGEIPLEAVKATNGKDTLYWAGSRMAQLNEKLQSKFPGTGYPLCAAALKYRELLQKNLKELV